MKKIIIALIASFALSTVGIQPAFAAGSLSLTGSATAYSAKTYTLTVSLRPAKANVKISVYRILLGSTKALGSAKTNRSGKATIKFKATNSSMLLEARASGYSSKRKSVKVYVQTTVSVSWPNTQDSSICENMFARVSVTPKSAGRTVWSQYWNNQTDLWENEYSATTDSNGVAWVKIGYVRSGGTYEERIYVPSVASFSSAAFTDELVFGPCGSSTPTVGTVSGNASSISGYEYDTFNFSWTTDGWDPTDWVDEDALIVFDVCDPYWHTCTVSDSGMPHDYQSAELTYDPSDSGSFSWTPEEYGNYVVRISIWDNGVMLYYTYWGDIDVSSY